MKWRFDQLIAGGAATVHSLKGEHEELDFDCKRKKTQEMWANRRAKSRGQRDLGQDALGLSAIQWEACFLGC